MRMYIIILDKKNKIKKKISFVEYFSHIMGKRNEINFVC